LRVSQWLDRFVVAGWRSYAFLISAVIVAGYAYLMATEFHALLCLDIAVTAVGIVGLFAYAYRRPLLKRRFWALWALVLPSWDLLFNFVLYRQAQHGVGTLGKALSLIPFVPEYVALWLYGFKSASLWAGAPPGPPSRVITN
jgi:hypothetical protein